MSRFYLQHNVYDAALSRIGRLFDEFPQVVVAFSGGKDSTVLFHLALEVARKKNRLPLPVFWLDQEAEWQHTVDYVRTVMHHPDVKPYWFQGPFRLFNATTTSADPWLHCWRDGDEWIRPKEPDSIHVNLCGTDRFKELFDAFPRKYFGTRPLAMLGGMRCEENPGRAIGLTGTATYKDITWGHIKDKKRQHYGFYPLYDWSYRDIWKCIHDNGYNYCKLYDFQYQYGINVMNMRVSNVHHETAVRNLLYLQEVEPDTWNKIITRVGGANAVTKCPEAYTLPDELPPMFASWREYRDYLLENLILVHKDRESFRKQFAMWDARYRMDDPQIARRMMRMSISCLLVNDTEKTKERSFAAAHRSWLKGHGRHKQKIKDITP